PSPASILFPYTTLFRSADPDAPGPFSFADEDRLRAILSGAGFGAIDVQRFDVAVSLGATPRSAADIAVQIGAVSRFVREVGVEQDRKSTRLNSSHEWIS